MILCLAVLVEVRLVTDRQTQGHSIYRGCIESRGKNLKKMTKLTKILGKSYEKLKKILRKTYDELTITLRNETLREVSKINLRKSQEGLRNY